jgi:mRNA-degrading endonuclease RelE of RelBE toxin-antitoxin system
MASYHVDLAKSAIKDLRGIDRSWIPKIIAKIENLENDPRPSDCKKLVGSDHT